MTLTLLNFNVVYAYDAAKPLPTITGNQANDLVNVAYSQKGYSGYGRDDTVYGSAYGINGSSWCAAFVSWCADKAGIGSDIVYRHTYVPTMISWYKNKGTFYTSTPQHGDIVFFEGQDYDGIAGHVGIVDYADNNYVYYIHGNNSSDVVAYSQEALGSNYILGYGRPQYKTSHVDLGTNFFGVIFNTACGKAVSYADGYVKLNTEIGHANQVWYFVRQSDGSYAITSAINGKALEMYNGITNDASPLRVHDVYWGGAYQSWFIYPQGNGYIIKSKHYQEQNKVMDLYGNYTADGTSININTQNNGNAQI